MSKSIAAIATKIVTLTRELVEATRDEARRRSASLAKALGI
jgi:hypothetical protein